MENIAKKPLSETYSCDIQAPQYDELLSAIEIRLLKYEELKSSLIEIAKDMGLGNLPNLLGEDDGIFVDSDGTQSLLRIGDIKYINTNGGDSNIFLSDSSKVSIKKTISNWKRFLSSELFTRINRSIIINLKFVETISKCNNGNYQVKISGIQAPITIDGKYVADIKSKKS